MRIVLKHLTPLPNCKYQYRRVWPADVRAARPDLPREKKKTFSVTGGEREAVRVCLDLDREFEKTQSAVRSAGGNRPDWEVTEEVARWFEKLRDEFQSVVSEQAGVDEDERPIIVEETGADFERDRILLEAEKRGGLDALGHPKDLTREEELKLEALKLGEPPVPPLKISDAVAIYRKKHLNGRTDKATEMASAQFIEFADDLPLERIRRTTVVEWVDDLITRREQSGATVKRRIGTMKAIVNFVTSRELYTGGNPFRGIAVPKHASKPRKRLPFHRTHLQALDDYLAKARVKAETRWLIALLRGTGCRPSEIGGLKAEDLSLDSEIPFAFIRESEDRRLKTAESERRVPLIAAALEAARLAKAARPKGWLFPTLAPKNADANDNPAMSARINKVIRAAGIARTSKLVAYSFRHTVGEALDQVPGITLTIRERVMGRKKPEYGASDQPLEVSLEALKAALPLLGKVDEVLYTEEEMTIAER